MIDLEKWNKMRKLLPSMGKEEFFTKYTESCGARDASFLLKEIKKLHAIDNPTKTRGEREYAKNACNRFVKIAVENPALYDFVLDTDDEYWKIVDPNHKIEKRSRLASEFFIPWIANEVPRAIALEVVYGYGIDIYGNYRKIPQTDPYYYFVFKNELFAAIMERGIATVGFLNALQPNKVAILGAGMAPEFRHLGYSLKPGQHAILIDNDPTIVSDVLLKDLPFKSQINYIHSDIDKALYSSKLKNLDALTAPGLICYMWDKFPQILTIAKQIIRPGGAFIFELYPHYWEWPRNRDIKGFYLPLTLFDSIAQAEAKVKEIGKYLGITNIKSQRFHDDFGNETMVLFKLTMPK